MSTDDSQPFSVAASSKSYKRQSRNHPSSFSECLVAACIFDIFMVPRTKLLPRDQREDLQSLIPLLPNSPFKDLPVKRVMAWLDAITPLLVKQPRKEVISVAYVPTPANNITLVIGQNGSPDGLDEAEKHLQAIWTTLKNARATRSPAGREGTPDEFDIPTDASSKLFHQCYIFSRERLKRQFDKANGNFMYEALTNARRNKDTPPQGKERIPLWDVQWGLVDLIIQLFEAYNRFLSEEGSIVNVMQLCSETNRWLNRGLQGRGEFLDGICTWSSFNASFSSSVIWSGDLVKTYVSDPSLIRQGASFERRLKKILTLDSCIFQLLVLTRSSSFGYILDKKDLVIKRVNTPDYGYLNYNLATNEELKAMMSSGRVPCSHASLVDKLRKLNMERGVDKLQKFGFRLEVHAECKVLAFLILHGLVAFNYISATKLSCLGCFDFVECYNKIAEAMGLQTYHLRGSHMQAYPWIAPQTPITPQILEEMRKVVEDYFRNLITLDRPRTLSESSSGSFEKKTSVNVDWAGVQEDTHNWQVRSTPYHFDWV
ncbi:uncharacterized protein FOMMEDRAFT_163700 [Fomitiporia mediterranea MF3/22]|uniref:Uncharacterized protein n=1 Tax=Fomitiporia mediterranea (strain MF3/22) TaxID=694068 RepID=R7SF94_FOMME|nr:uncharacterized protein FOMMEDRAFT_163700 [Fomitiporia mediterranea MF3/22]EJC97373.1 hypothetical protein FOMMEDRAFT_163700 [Fomitiporia mediterranea MF3/22]